MEPDYKALYFELAHAVSLVSIAKRAAFDGQADGQQYWQAQSHLDSLVGAALCWEDDPELYAQMLDRRRARLDESNAFMPGFEGLKRD